MARRTKEGLTPRQQEILDLANEGLTVKQAAIRLELAESGIYNHTKRIREKGYAVTWHTEDTTTAAEAAQAKGNGAVPPHLTAAHDARVTLLADAEQYVERLKEALGDRRQRLDENHTEAERIKTEAEELDREISELAAAVVTAEEALAGLADLTETPSTTAT